ncbi:FUSC family protein [Streptomyces sp. BH055]|uniref:FUSC family protein n=1 Tax=unclassified Streptomyces TaxID=2593676 RepID=UPI003BB62AA7
MLDRIRGCGQWWARALRSSGHERETVLFVGKCALAATLAWWVAHDLMNAMSPAFAPFSAALTMNTTIHTSVWQALRYAGAVTVGVAVQAAIGFTVGPDLVAFVLVALIALIIAQWPALGAQRSQVPTAAFFAFSTYAAATSTADKASQLGQIVLLVLVGCGIGLIVHLCIAPPLRYRSAEHGLHALAAEIEALLDDVADGLGSGDVDADRAEHWRTTGGRLQDAVENARSGLSTAEHSLPFNPRRLLPAHRGYLSFERYRDTLDALERAVYQLGSLTRSLGTWREKESTYTYAPVLERYADFARRLRDIAHVIAEIDSDTLAEQADEMCKLAATAQEARERITESAKKHDLPLADSTRPYGVLVVESTRLMEEFQHTCDVLKATADA